MVAFLQRRGLATDTAIIAALLGVSEECCHGQQDQWRRLTLGSAEASAVDQLPSLTAAVDSFLASGNADSMKLWEVSKEGGLSVAEKTLCIDEVKSLRRCVRTAIDTRAASTEEFLHVPSSALPHLYMAFLGQKPAGNRDGDATEVCVSLCAHLSCCYSRRSALTLLLPFPAPGLQRRELHIPTPARKFYLCVRDPESPDCMQLVVVRRRPPSTPAEKSSDNLAFAYTTSASIGEDTSDSCVLLVDIPVADTRLFASHNAVVTAHQRIVSTLLSHKCPLMIEDIQVVCPCVSACARVASSCSLWFCMHDMSGHPRLLLLYFQEARSRSGTGRRCTCHGPCSVARCSPGQPHGRC